MGKGLLYRKSWGLEKDRAYTSGIYNLVGLTTNNPTPS